MMDRDRVAHTVVVTAALLFCLAFWFMVIYLAGLI